MVINCCASRVLGKRRRGRLTLQDAAFGEHERQLEVIFDGHEWQRKVLLWAEKREKVKRRGGGNKSAATGRHMYTHLFLPVRVEGHCRMTLEGSS